MPSVNWPSGLPNPTASGFAFVHKAMGVVLPFASGRRRVTRTRMVAGNGFVVSANFQFAMTLEEYFLFTDFYGTWWKRLSPQGHSLVFTWEGQTWSGWPTSNVSQTRTDNTWNVSFNFECTIPQFGFTFTTEQLDPATPLWPLDQFGFQAGAKFERISRDEVQVADNLLVSRSNIRGDKFVIGEITVTSQPIEQIFKIAEWWGVACKHGALPFKIPASTVDLGWIDGANASLSSGYYMGKVLTPPKFTFDGYFGTVSFTVALSVLKSTASNIKVLISNTGSILVTNTGKRLIGSF
jgi:hypothetical protein